MKKSQSNSERIWSFDILRILSTFSVIMMHVTSEYIYSLDLSSNSWLAVAVYNSVFHYGVPIFVMISGALFMNPNREIHLRNLFFHNILRMSVIYLVWSAAYGLFDFLQYKTTWKDSWRFYVWEIVNSRNHLWFLPMLIGIYLLIPILSVWIRNATKENIAYFLMLFIVLQVGCVTILPLSTHEIVEFIVNLRNIQMVCSYLGYFVLGYYLIHVGVSAIMKKIIYVSFPIAFILSIISVVFISRHRGSVQVGMVDSFSALTFIIATAMFLLLYEVGNKIKITSKMSLVLENLGKDTFGTYLIHIAVLEYMMTRGYNAVVPNAAIGILVCVLICFGVSMIAAAILRRIPFIGKYIC